MKCWPVFKQDPIFIFAWLQVPPEWLLQTELHAGCSETFEQLLPGFGQQRWGS